MPSGTHVVRCLSVLLVAFVCASLVTAQAQPNNVTRDWVEVIENDDGTVLAADLSGVYVFRDWDEYMRSSFFDVHGMKCGQPLLPQFSGAGAADGTTSDCNSVQTNPASEYAPAGGTLYDVPVVFHILQHPNGNGFVSDAQVAQQIQVLNEDFGALPGSNGANGTDVRIQFHLATEDPDGNPSTGITRATKASWYNDSGSYWNSVGWDTTKYLNIYTNTAGGSLGYAYVPSSGGVVGQPWEGVRLYWRAVGSPGPIGPPYHLGRTGTHEVGHWAGLYHTFDGGCTDGSSPACYSNGDLICDTNPESSPMGSGSCSRTTCGSPDPVDNYLDYSDDVCMERFTEDQARRMRCTLANFRSALFDSGPVNAAPTVTITAPSGNITVSEGTSVNFAGTATDPEDGNLSGSIAWSSNLSGSLGSGASINEVLSVGTHTVTASVTDSGGKSASDNVQVTVQSAGGVSLSANIYKVKGRIRVDLSWSGAGGSQVEVYRDGNLITTTANDGFYTDLTGQKGSQTFTYQVCETGGGACSNPVTVSI
ncbi:MAG: zinc metalloprotease [Planctomycetota bacterium]|jgi:hypothetical protein